MLVLSRKKGEQVVIEGKVIVKVLSVKGDRVQLGFDAPKDVRIDRKEVAEQRAQLPRHAA